MNDGKIRGNSAGNNGGGVNVDSGSFEMYGGVISRNTANYRGGGVYINSSGSFIKGPAPSGYIYGGNETGNDESGRPLKNTATSAGYVAYAVGPKMRYNTAGPSDSMNSGTAGALGGWDP